MIGKIINLGSSSNGNSFFIEILRKGYTLPFGLLLDCGFSYDILKKKLRNEGLTMNDVNAVLITHKHGDHARSIANLVEVGKRVYAPQTTFDFYNVAVKNKRSIVKALEQKSIADGISIIPIPLEHQEITGEMVENYGYIIDIQNEFRVLYFTDMKSIDFNLRPYKADLIIVEANYERRVIQFAIKNQSMSEFQIKHYRRVLHSHMSVQRTAKWLATQDLTNTKTIILMHLTTNYQNRNSGKYKEIVINELKRSGKKHIPRIMVARMNGGLE